jgi:uncharacterized protein
MKFSLKWTFFSTIVTATVLVLLDALVYEKNFFQIKKFKIGNPDSGGTPIRLLQLADLHLKDYLTTKHRRLAAAIRKLQPDLILITGDAMDKHGHPEVLDDLLALMDPDIPKAAILGNHEYESGLGPEVFRRTYEKYGVDLLVNDSVCYMIRDHRMCITGLDDLIHGQDDLKRAFQRIENESNHLVLLHSPLHQESLLQKFEALKKEGQLDASARIRYMLAGHNHGGQVTLFGLYAPYLPKKSGKYLKGWYNQKEPYLYVSKGFGTSTIPVRFWARAEITLFLYYP